MTFEVERGCGYRKPHGMYLITLGPGVSCDRLPVPIAPCECCGFEPKQFRSFTWVPGNWLGDHRGAVGTVDGKSSNRHRGPRCPDKKTDPVCSGSGEPRLLMWVGRKFYSPDEFAAEAAKLGISKRIPDIPDGLVVGKTWVFMGHPDACQEPLSWAMHWLFEDGEVYRAPGIFQAFVPQAIEIILFESEATAERIAKEEARGVKVVIIPDGAPDARVSWRPGEPKPDLTNHVPIDAPPLPPVAPVPSDPAAANEGLAPTQDSTAEVE
jgi:hypothetical protein